MKKTVLVMAVCVLMLVGMVWAADQATVPVTVGNASYDVKYYDIAAHWLDDPNYRDTTTIYDTWHYKNLLMTVARNTDGNCDSAALTVYFYGRLHPSSAWFFMDSTIAMPGKAVVAGKGDTLSYIHQLDLDAKAFIGVKDIQIIRSTTNANNCSCYVKQNRVVLTKH